MADVGLIARPLGNGGGLNWDFLIELLTCGILSVFFLFYFNRLFATLLSYIVRAYTWRRYKAYVDITSLQISLLGGRLFFKSLRYQARNETILIHDGRITWRYWLRKAQQPEIYRQRAEADVGDLDDSSDRLHEKTESGSDPETARLLPKNDLSCRFHIRVSGIEAFFYNHSPSYDHVMSQYQAAKDSTATREAAASTEENTAASKLEKHATETEGPDVGPLISASSSPPAFLSVFPIEVECRKAAAAVGNEHTPSILVAKTQGAAGRIDAATAGPSDIFKLLFSFNLSDVEVSMRSNHDYTESQAKAAGRHDPDKRKASTKFSRLRARMGSWLSHAFRLHRRRPSSIRTFNVHNRDLNTSESGTSAEEEWHGLARFLYEHTDKPENVWSQKQYARTSSLAELKDVGFKFYWDIAGPVRHANVDAFRTGIAATGELSESPPSYGLEVSIREGLVTYGPWSDRERVWLQSMLFPASMVDSKPLIIPKLGETRLATIFKMTFMIDEKVTVRLPTREPSKDWRWQSPEASQASEFGNGGLKRRRNATRARSGSKADKILRTEDLEKRPFAWLDFTVAKDTIVHYDMDLYARKDGFKNRLNVQVKHPEIFSSVNHDLLWSSGDIIVDGNLSNPLSWNAQRTWTFDISCDSLELFILRDHMFLLTDLISDWTAGSSASYFTFVPFHYVLRASLRNFNLFLGCNDANLISRPTDLDDNNFLVLRGQALDLDFSIPLLIFKPPSSNFTFDVVASHLMLDLLNPPRSTLHELLKDKRMAHLPHLTLKGNMMSFSDQSPQLTDILQLDIRGESLDMTVFGYLLRYFINFKENYFGDALHFQTFEEYQKSRGDTSNALEQERQKYKFSRSNDLDVILSIAIDKPTLRIPTNLYSLTDQILISLDAADVDLRVTNYYLDLTVDVSPLKITGDRQNLERDLEDCVRVIGAHITGHRLFGLPPAEPAYVSSWDITTGRIAGKMSSALTYMLSNAGRSFAYAIADVENTLPISKPLDIHDITFANVTTGPVDIDMTITDYIAGLHIDPVGLTFNDYADTVFSSLLSTRLSNMRLTCQKAPMLGSAREESGTFVQMPCLLFLQTSIDVSLATRAKGFSTQTQKQQLHLRKHDVRTKRATFLFQDRYDGETIAHDGIPILPPAMLAPHLPSVLSNSSSASIHSRVPLSRKQSRPEHTKTSVATGISRSSRSAYTTVHDSQNYQPPREVPVISQVSDSSTTWLQNGQIQGVQLDTLSDDSSHVLLNLDVNPGLTILLRPQILEVVQGMIRSLQPSTYEDVLDDLQLSVISQVQDSVRAHQRQKSTTSLRFRLPTAIIRMAPDECSEPTSAAGLPYTDLTLMRATVSLRVHQFEHAQNANPSSDLILYSNLGRAQVEVGTLNDSPEISRAVVLCKLDGLVGWLARVKDTPTASSASLHMLTMSIDTEELRLLATLIGQVQHQLADRVNTVTDVVELKSLRSRQLLEFMASNHESGSDPVYLSRMTYVLRAFPDHLRNQNSWKMAGRIRHALQCLPPEQLRELDQKLLVIGVKDTALADPTPSDLLGWCAWDIPTPQESTLYNYVLGEVLDESPEDDQPLKITADIGLIRLMFGSGTSSSEVSLADLTVDVSLQPPSEPEGLMLVEGNLRRLWHVSARTSAIFIRLRWQLVAAIDSMAESLRLLQASHKPPPRSLDLKRISSSRQSKMVSRQELHILVSTDEATTIIETPNLQQVSALTQFKISVLNTIGISEQLHQTWRAFLTCEEAKSELCFSKNTLYRIWKAALRKPLVYCNVHMSLAEQTDLDIGGNYGSMNIAVEQEPIGMLHIIDRVLHQEVLQILSLIEQLKHRSTRETETRETAKSEVVKKVRINLALLAGPFELNFAILRSLTMNIRGKMGNIHVRPRDTKDSLFNVDMDIGTIRFAAVSQTSGITGAQALFHTPSINAHAEVLLTKIRRSIDITSTVNHMSIEASAVQNILILLRRAEVQSAIDALKIGASDLKDRATNVLSNIRGPKMTPRETIKSLPIFYKISLVAAGVQIKTIAPVLRPQATTAELSFGLGMTYVDIDNSESPPESKLRLPQISGRVETVYADLQQLNSDQRSSIGHARVGLKLDYKNTDNVDRDAVGDVSASSDVLDLEVSSETASTLVDIITHIQKKIVDLDLTMEVQYMKLLRLAQKRSKERIRPDDSANDHDAGLTLETLTNLAPTNLSFSLNKIKLRWAHDPSMVILRPAEVADLELTLARVELGIRERNLAHLSISSLQLQMTSEDILDGERSLNSALIPSLIFIVRFSNDDEGLRLDFQATGQTIDFQLHSGFARPLGLLVTSGQTAVQQYRDASKQWRFFKEGSPMTAKAEPVKPKNPFGTIHLASLTMDVAFAGGNLTLRGDDRLGNTPVPNRSTYRDDPLLMTRMKTPGVALKVQYTAATDTSGFKSLISEFRIDGSSNTVHPGLVTVILQMTDNVKAAMQIPEGDSGSSTNSQAGPTVSTILQLPDESVLDSNEILARTKFNLSLRILPQEFGLSCQPIAKVNARAIIKDIFINLSTLEQPDQQRFVAISARIGGVQASVQHVYSKEATFSFNLDDINLTVMNNRHAQDSVVGLSAALKISPISTSINARQVQDVLLFREIWFPARPNSGGPSTLLSREDKESEGIIIERYRQVSAVAAFPWNAVIRLDGALLDIDFGQSIGRSTINIQNIWVSSTKTSGWKQELCASLESVHAESNGRMSGYIVLDDLAVRTLIEWPLTSSVTSITPLIQASLAFQKLKVKAAFDYQPFAFADSNELSILMFNVREATRGSADRLVATLNLGQISAFGTATSPAQAMGLYQAFDRLIQEKQTAFKQAVSEVQRHLQRPSVQVPYTLDNVRPFLQSRSHTNLETGASRLRTDVLVSVGSINAGIFPSTFFDTQVLKLEAVDAEARFLVDVVQGRVHSNLGLILGQLQVSLAGAKKMQMLKSLADVELEAVMATGIGARGGVILRVPRLVASMRTWQRDQTKIIDYIFRSTFEGKVDVGWNLSRIGFIRTMWNMHTRSLAARLGKSLPESAIRITAAPDRQNSAGEHDTTEEGDRGRITAVVSMPLSRYEYVPLEPPIIETPQLRDMGEATPPLEWIGLQREKLPHIIHQVVIVALLELAKEVEDAYGRILGNS